MKKRKFPKFKFLFNKDFERLGSSTILIKGSLLTCIILSIASGFIDLAFFSGLSKSILHIGTIPLAAAVLYTIISTGFISAKFWLAMKIGMVRELRARLEAEGYSWANRLKKALVPLHIWHKFLILISIITALSLSVISIGSAMKDAERNSTNITVSIDELKNLKDQRKADNTDKRTLVRGNLEGTATSKITAESEASRYWPNIEKWQAKLEEIHASQEYNELDDKDKPGYIDRLRKPYMTKAPSFIGKNIDFISRTELVTRFQNEAKKTEIDKTSMDAYNKLTEENEAEIKSTILALENLYKHPNSYKDGLIIEGKTVSFLDEEGNPLDITQVIGMLQGLREEWKSNTDIGESSQIFMLISEVVTSKAGEGSSSGSGIAELLMMVFIAMAGIAQEFLIALFTPKAAIDRKLLRQVSEYLLWKDKNEKERFLLKVYDDYYGDGVFSQNDYEAKCRKAVEHLGSTIEDIIERYSKKPEVKPIEKPVVRQIKETPKEEPLQIIEDKPTIIEVKEEKKEPPKRVIKEEKKEVGYSDAVEKALREAEEL